MKDIKTADLDCQTAIRVCSNAGIHANLGKKSELLVKSKYCRDIILNLNEALVVFRVVYIAFVIELSSIQRAAMLFGAS